MIKKHLESKDKLTSNEEKALEYLNGQIESLAKLKSKDLSSPKNVQKGQMMSVHRLTSTVTSPTN